MTIRPIGEVVSISTRLNLILSVNMQDPQSGAAMRLREEIESLPPEDHATIRRLLQERLDQTCDEVAGIIGIMLRAEAQDPAQPTLSGLSKPEEDPLEIPDFLQRNTT